MIAILIGAGVSGVVLGATSRIIFLLPAALMAAPPQSVAERQGGTRLGFVKPNLNSKIAVVRCKYLI